MDHLGPEAWGPGNLALGRGYLTMRYLDPALLALEEAWKSGYRTPDVAYALCKTHCEYYIRILDEEQLRDIPPSPERVAYHLQSARDYYPLAAGATWEPPELCGVMLLIFGGKEAEALLQARKLAENNPWFYEAKVEEAYAFQTLGYARQMAGDYRGAHALYAQSETVARLAQDIGRSDITCHLASLDWRIDWLENPRLRPHEALATGREAEQVVDTVLAIRPAYPRAISAKVHVILSQARALKALGRDPRPELARAERFLAGARPEFAFTWLIPIKADLIRRTKEELGYRR